MSDEPQTAQDLFDALSAPFPTEYIEWRIGSTTKDKTKGMALAYVNARKIMDRLDTVAGPGNWQRKYSHANGKTVCDLAIRMDGEWVWKADGAGDTDFEAEKGALSDAFKRAAVNFGVGRYLYDLDAPWVALEAEGRRIPDSEKKKLSELHEKAATKVGWGPRSGLQVYRLLLKVARDHVLDAISAQEFKDKNKPEIALLPAEMRRNLEKVLDRIGANAEQEAA